MLRTSLRFAALGWRLLPLAPSGQCLLDDPEASASSSERTILQWAERWPDAGVGLLLGRRSGIVCVETSAPTAETVVEWLTRLHHDEVPTFRQDRTISRLFQYASDAFGAEPRAIEGLRVLPRGIVALPPTLAPGCSYCEWLVEPAERSIPDPDFRLVDLDDDAIRGLYKLIADRRELDPTF